MPLHWTYCQADTDSDLQQGDIVGRSDELLSVLSDVHAYFCDDRYTSFLVLTQTCDLVRRGGKECKARYLTLAVIRELDQALTAILNEISGSGYDGVFVREYRLKAEQFLSRLVDQNEQARGLFYLHPDAEVGIATPSLAFLRVTIALRQEHYEAVLKSRTGSLKPEFANKLGWLSGNLFSRIATPDWNEEAGVGTSDALVKRYLEEAVPLRQWIPESWIRSAEREDFQFDNLSDANEELAQFAPPNSVDVLASEVVRNAVGIRFDSMKDALKARLATDEELYELLLGELLGRLEGVGNAAKTVVDELRRSDRFASAVATQLTSVLRKASDVELENPFSAAIDNARGTNAAIPPVTQSLKEIFDSLANGDTDEWLERVQTCPFYSDAVLDRLNSIVAEYAGDDWLDEVKKLVNRIRNSSRVKASLK